LGLPHGFALKKPSKENLFEQRSEEILYGAFKGMGDLLCASPVIIAELNAGSKVRLLLFPNPSLVEFVKLIEFGQNRKNLTIHFLPVGAAAGWLRRFAAFFRDMRSLSPTRIWISPHAPAPASSWKIPALLWLVRRFYWPNARLAGVDSERMSRFFDIRIQVDRSLPLIDREWTAYLAQRSDSRLNGPPPPVQFIPAIANGLRISPEYDLLVHPGANARNRSWPAAHYAAVIERMPPGCRIAVLGLPGDVEELRRVLPHNRDIHYLMGTLEQSIATLTRGRVLLTMDSGNAHFAHFLGLPAVTLFGKADPRTIISKDTSVLPVYQQRFPCQPCERVDCSQPEVYCMNSIDPALVAEKLLALIGKRPPKHE
jgi:heptosyltransferase II